MGLALQRFISPSESFEIRSIIGKAILPGAYLDDHCLALLKGTSHPVGVV
jgi:hypothetical protein